VDLSFEGKSALVTGGASGIGYAISASLSASGAAVALLDVDGESAQRAAAEIGEGRADLLAQEVDITDFEAAQEAVARVVKWRDGLDIVVNCAGRGTPGTRFQDESPETWRALINLNLLGTIYVCHSVIPHLVKSSSGRIINIASDAGRTGSAGETVYSAAKGGVIALTRSLARELARHQITVNCVSPGPTDTPMLRAFDARAGGVVDKLISATPLRRLAQPQDIAAAVTFLASESAGHITGRCSASAAA
jgi:2-hydroxycyclohexanecarboxyl-CoA dehydrogenase